MIIYGKNPVFEALNLGIAKTVFIRKGVALYDKKINAAVKILDKEAFDAQFHRDAQGVAAEIEDIHTVSLAEVSKDLIASGKAVILDRIQDPQNYGSIVRSAHCFGVKYIIVPRYNQSPITAAVCKASAGALLYTTIVEETNLSHVVDKLKDMKFTIIASDMEATVNLQDVHIDGNVALLIGSEGAGIRDKLVSRSDIVAKIPMQGRIDSLNASQSAAIMMYEIF